MDKHTATLKEGRRQTRYPGAQRRTQMGYWRTQKHSIGTDNKALAKSLLARSLAKRPRKGWPSKTENLYQ